MKTFIIRQDLLKLIDENFADSITQDEYEILKVDPSTLLIYSRLDLAIKILYLKFRAYDDLFYIHELYRDHIKAFSAGSYTEPGNPSKNTLQKYIDDFDSIDKSIKTTGVDESRSVIPISENGGIANGAHRVASCYVTEKKVPIVQLKILNHQYNSDFFLQRGMGQNQIEKTVTKFIEFAENCYVALVWPSASGHQKELDKLIPNIIFQSKVTLNHTGAHNLLSQVYFDESWLGSREGNYPGVENKLVECFRTFSDLRVIAFQEDSLEQVLLLKEKIRELFSIGKHSVHISDTKEEAVRIARILFNENSVHFLNYGHPNKYSEASQKLKDFKDFISMNNMNVDDIVLDSSIILSLYGLRKCNDIDYLSLDTQNICTKDGAIQNHIEDLKFHGQTKEVLILDPGFHFYYDDLKFVSFPQLYEMKKNRGDEKDKNDIAIMVAAIQKNLFKKLIAISKQRFYFLRVRTKLKLMAALRLIGLYKVTRFIYRKIKR